MAKAKKPDGADGDDKPATPARKTAAKKESAPKEAAPAKAEAPKKEAAGKKPAAAAPAAAASGKKTAAKASKPSGSAQSAGTPLIDTGLAAQTAAAMVAGRLAAAAGGASPTQQNRPESATFKSLKEGLNKPAAGSLGGILGTGTGANKFPAGFSNPKHGGGPSAGGRNQTFGADVNRAGVPRRTGGG